MVIKGGMYEMFGIIINIYDNNLEIKFAAKDLYDKCDLSKQAISNNLQRLISVGLLTKEVKIDNKGKKTIYSFNTEVAYDFITNCLYK